MPAPGEPVEQATMAYGYGLSVSLLQLTPRLHGICQ